MRDFQFNPDGIVGALLKSEIHLMIKKNIGTILVSSLIFFASTNVVPSLAETTIQQSEKQNQTVIDWFKTYDQIRRDAEMPFREKLKYGSGLKKALKSGGKLSDSHKAFIQKMVSKYATASAAMKTLGSVPETKELQEGYLEYFIEMERTFADCLKSEELTETQLNDKAAAKEKLETLNQKIRKIDSTLRKQYDIEKH